VRYFHPFGPSARNTITRTGCESEEKKEKPGCSPRLDFDHGLVRKDYGHFWEIMNNLRAKLVPTDDMLVC
jgi:hypothetical protein